MRPIDAPLVAKLATLLAAGDRAAAELRKSYTSTNSAGAAVPSAWLRVLVNTSDAARKLASELGLPPTARARLDLPVEATPVGDDDQPRDPTRPTLAQYLDMHPDRKLQ